MKKILTTLGLIIGCSMMALQAQEKSLTATLDNPVDSVKTRLPRMNMIKTNLTGIVVNNYALQYERILSRKFSLALSYRIMPEGNLPFKNKIKDMVNDGDPDIDRTIDNMLLKGSAITPELRFYTSKKGYGRGFYLAPFFRHARFETRNVLITYDNSLLTKNQISLSGSLTSNTAGLLLGLQLPIGKSFLVDCWLLGPHYGGGKGDFTGIPAQSLNQLEQDDIRQQLEDLDIPFADKTVLVTANKVSMRLDGSWGGVRAGISIGLRF